MNSRCMVRDEKEPLADVPFCSCSTECQGSVRSELFKKHRKFEFGSGWVLIFLVWSFVHSVLSMRFRRFDGFNILFPQWLLKHLAQNCYSTTNTTKVRQKITTTFTLSLSTTEKVIFRYRLRARVCTWAQNNSKSCTRFMLKFSLSIAYWTGTNLLSFEHPARWGWENIGLDPSDEELASFAR